MTYITRGLTSRYRDYLRFLLRPDYEYGTSLYFNLYLHTANTI